MDAHHWLNGSRAGSGYADIYHRCLLSPDARSGIGTDGRRPVRLEGGLRDGSHSADIPDGGMVEKGGAC